MKKLQDKVAIVTGAGQGVGLGIAQSLADGGANLTITGRDAKKLESVVADLSARGAEILVVAGDARKRESAKKTVAATIERFGKLDVLINNAQSTSPGTPLEDYDDETINMVLESGFLGTLYYMQAAFPHMKENGGSIVNLGSREGIFGGLGMSVYAATKEAIRGLSRTAAREWGQYGIRVNVICPAALSPAAQKYLDEHPKEREMYRSNLALGYFGDCYEDIGPVAAFLASAEAKYVTGQTLNVDGGQMML